MLTMIDLFELAELEDARENVFLRTDLPVIEVSEASLCDWLDAIYAVTAPDWAVAETYVTAR